MSVVVQHKPTDCRAATFAWMIPHLSNVARIYGYALGLHGSMARDLDLIAVPWTREAAPNETLVEALRDAVGGMIRNDEKHAGNRWDERTRNPTSKPHGRLAWSIYFANHNFYIDLSVMPLVAESEEDDE